MERKCADTTTDVKTFFTFFFILVTFFTFLTFFYYLAKFRAASRLTRSTFKITATKLTYDFSVACRMT